MATMVKILVQTQVLTLLRRWLMKLLIYCREMLRRGIQEMKH